ncbi:GDSL-type esterase/lipase family protein [Acrocarpospora catenulata]|uniref:GDSL-type esterase/lipase family protein n=1 Tax=Acrocarpospora catenulata TaxID=2836182 RepID=UPI001BDAB60B|nr:GDSL-type esterase/lipase family protein [Acrocarpospora catenulata]
MIKKVVPALALALTFPGTAFADTPERGETPPRVVLAALGDSISVGFNACGLYLACRSRSWSIGDDKDVNSHFLRLRADGGKVGRRALAVPGATSADLLRQVRRAVRAKATYVTLLVGAQDACTPTEQRMTPVETYRERLDMALAELSPTGARLVVASIPDVYRLWQVAKDKITARVFWTAGRVCQSMLARPGSLAAPDEARRQRVRERVQAYNAELAAACQAYGPDCRYDGGAVFDYPFTLAEVSPWDYFHPNTKGQRALAEVTFRSLDVPVKV